MKNKLEYDYEVSPMLKVSVIACTILVGAFIMAVISLIIIGSLK